jgi:hypothetical protein
MQCAIFGITQEGLACILGSTLAYAKVCESDPKFRLHRVKRRKRSIHIGMKSTSRDLVEKISMSYSRAVVLSDAVHLFSGGPVEPGVVDGEASKDARIS